METTDGLLLLSYREIRDGLSDGRTLTIDIITPPYPCAGVGTLRVVRVCEGPGVVSLTAAYDGYQRL